MIIVLLIQIIFKLEMIEINKIMLVWIVKNGQVYCKVMMDTHTKMKMMIIVLEVVKIVISKQQQYNFMD